MAARQGTLRSGREGDAGPDRALALGATGRARAWAATLRKRQVEEAQATVTLLETRAPDTLA